jgi:colanic acid biosynthesis glycosyl transferase WcaI
LLEYMACERPVIVAVDGQARQMVEAARAGVFVEPEDSDALVDAILNLVADPQQRQRMGSSGREYIVRQFSRERTARSYLTVLEKLISAEERSGR